MNDTFDDIWQRKISDTLQPHNWDSSYLYSATGTTEQHTELQAHFKTFSVKAPRLILVGCPGAVCATGHAVRVMGRGSRGRRNCTYQINAENIGRYNADTWLVGRSVDLEGDPP